MDSKLPDYIQVVCVHWGNKYPKSIVNILYRSIVKHCSRPIRFVCITDQFDAGYEDGVVLKPFPQFALPLDQLKSGCLAKLGMFAPGMLEEEVPTLYLDLDTMILGDIARLVEYHLAHSGLSMLRSHYIPFWRVQKHIKWMLNGRYYFGNSSVMTFCPERCYAIFEQFNEALRAGASGPRPRYLQADDRFISCFARDQVRVFPSNLAVKFTDEYMAPWLWVEALRKRVPQVRKRRAGLVAITFASNSVKPWTLNQLLEGETITFKRRKMRWHHARYSQYWQEALNDGSGRKLEDDRWPAEIQPLEGGIPVTVCKDQINSAA